MHSISRILVPVLLGLAGVACGGRSETPAGPSSTQDIVLTASADRVEMCRHLQFSAVSRVGIELPPVAWSTSDPMVAIVTRDGSVTGVSGGGVDVIARAGNLTARKRILVYPRAVSVWFVWVRPDLQQLTLGQTLQLTAVADANDALYEYPVTWESVSPSVATVSQNGVVTTRAVGTAQIRATFVDSVGDYDRAVCPPRAWYGSASINVVP